MVVITERTEAYKGFIITWQEPPLTSARLEANITSEERRGFTLIGGRAVPVEGRTHKDMLAKAKQCIDELLESHG